MIITILGIVAKTKAATACNAAYLATDFLANVSCKLSEREIEEGKKRLRKEYQCYIEHLLFITLARMELLLVLLFSRKLKKLPYRNRSITNHGQNSPFSFGGNGSRGEERSCLIFKPGLIE